MLEFLSIAAAGAVVVSMCVLGIHVASLEGGLLYPLRAWLTSNATLKYYESELEKIEQELRRATYEKDFALTEVLKKQQEIYKKHLWKRLWWRKPILLCPPCMTSLWSIIYVLLWMIAGYEIDFSYLPTMIPMSATITYFMLHKIL